MLKAKLARFYGWTDSEIDGLEYSKAVKYFESITTIEAQELIALKPIISYPHLKDTARGKVDKRMHEMAFPRKDEYLKSEDVAKQLARMLK